MLHWWVWLFSFSRVLIGSPLAGQPQKRTGDVYKCRVGKSHDSPCIKLNLPCKTINILVDIQSRPCKEVVFSSQFALPTWCFNFHVIIFGLDIVWSFCGNKVKWFLLIPPSCGKPLIHPSFSWGGGGEESTIPRKHCRMVWEPCMECIMGVYSVVYA